MAERRDAARAAVKVVDPLNLRATPTAIISGNKQYCLYDGSNADWKSVVYVPKSVYKEFSRAKTPEDRAAIYNREMAAKGRPVYAGNLSQAQAMKLSEGLGVSTSIGLTGAMAAAPTLGNAQGVAVAPELLAGQVAQRVDQANVMVQQQLNQQELMTGQKIDLHDQADVSQSFLINQQPEMAQATQQGLQANLQPVWDEELKSYVLPEVEIVADRPQVLQDTMGGPAVATSAEQGVLMEGKMDIRLDQANVAGIAVPMEGKMDIRADQANVAGISVPIEGKMDVRLDQANVAGIAVPMEGKMEVRMDQADVSQMVVENGQTVSASVEQGELMEGKMDIRLDQANVAGVAVPMEGKMDIRADQANVAGMSVPLEEKTNMRLDQSTLAWMIVDGGRAYDQNLQAELSKGETLGANVQQAASQVVNQEVKPAADPTVRVQVKDDGVHLPEVHASVFAAPTIEESTAKTVAPENLQSRVDLRRPNGYLLYDGAHPKDRAVHIAVSEAVYKEFNKAKTPEAKAAIYNREAVAQGKTVQAGVAERVNVEKAVVPTLSVQNELAQKGSVDLKPFVQDVESCELHAGENGRNPMLVVKTEDVTIRHDLTPNDMQKLETALGNEQQTAEQKSLAVSTVVVQSVTQELGSHNYEEEYTRTLAQTQTQEQTQTTSRGR